MLTKYITEILMPLDIQSKGSFFNCFQYLLLSYTLCCLEGTSHYLLSSEETSSAFFTI